MKKLGMKKTNISFVVVLIFSLLTGCNSNHDTASVKNGTYLMAEESKKQFLFHLLLFLMLPSRSHLIH